MGDDEARYGAMVEFLGTFPTLSGSPPEALADLSDGVALFEVLSEMYVSRRVVNNIDSKSAAGFFCICARPFQ